MQPSPISDGSYFTALYYKHAECILPTAGGIATRWFTNVQIERDEIPRSLAPVLSGLPTLVRSNINLDDQFFYRFAVADTKRIGAFLAFFRRSFAMLGYVHTSASDLGLPPEATIVQPFNWRAS